MFRCISGHQTNNLVTCENCGQEIDLEDGIKKLGRLPEIKMYWEEISILALGLPCVARKGLCVLNVHHGDAPKATETEFVSKSMLGETWYDIVKREGYQFKDWIAKTGFSKAKYKIILLDTTDPHSILAVRALQDLEHVTVFAVVADKSSNPLEANTSYVAMTLIQRKKLPVVVCSKTYVKNLSIFAEDMGLVTGANAFDHIINLLVSFVSDFIDVMTRDRKLGVQAHYFSAIFSASDLVYPKPKSVISLEHEEGMIETRTTELLSAYLFSMADVSMHEEIAQSFQREFRDGQLLGRTAKSINKTSKRGLYDIVMLLGTKNFDFDPLAPGYKQITEMNSMLKVPEENEE